MKSLVAATALLTIPVVASAQTTPPAASAPVADSVASKHGNALVAEPHDAAPGPTLLITKSH